jgi:N-acetylglucosamine-6-phosphate deacetylase
MDISIKNGEIYTLDGRSIAGSSITMLEGVQRLVRLGIPLDTALRLSTGNPAKAFGINRGRILPGFSADLVVLKENLELASVYIKGIKI